jgi:uncharacterized protein (DUF1684 family)
MDPALIVVLVLGVLAALAAFAAARRARRDRNRLDAEGRLADGEVLAVWPEGTAFRVRYRYLPEGAAQPVLRVEMAHCLRVLVPEVGERVKVRYDPRDHQRSRILRAGDIPG